MSNGQQSLADIYRFLKSLNSQMGQLNSQMGRVHAQMDHLEQNSHVPGNRHRREILPQPSDDPGVKDRFSYQRHREPMSPYRPRNTDRSTGGNEKLTSPTFVGRVNPEEYLDWEKKMEYIFKYYDYSEARKVSLATARFTAHALAWWDREVAIRRRNAEEPISTWDQMKSLMRRRYVPPYYHQELQRRFSHARSNTESLVPRRGDSCKVTPAPVPSRNEGETLRRPLPSREILCFECQGKGHYSWECPDRKTVILTPEGDYESQGELETIPTVKEDAVEYPDSGETLVHRQVPSVLTDVVEQVYQEDLFSTEGTIGDKVYNVYIQDRIRPNVAGHYVVYPLGLGRRPRPHPYQFQWLNDRIEFSMKAVTSRGHHKNPSFVGTRPVGTWSGKGCKYLEIPFDRGKLQFSLSI